MIFHVYILYSNSKDKYYIGYTSNLDSRLDKHNNGGTKSTRPGIPWKLVYFENFDTKTEALKRENAIKAKKSRIYIRRLLESYAC